MIRKAHAPSLATRHSAASHFQGSPQSATATTAVGGDATHSVNVREATKQTRTPSSFCMMRFSLLCVDMGLGRQAGAVGVWGDDTGTSI